MDNLFTARAEVGAGRDSHVAIDNFGCGEGDRVLVRKWHVAPEARHADPSPEEMIMRGWHDLAWPLGLVVYHLMRR